MSDHQKAESSNQQEFDTSDGLKDEIAQLREAIRTDPDNVEGHWKLALALESQGLIEAAIAEYTQTIRLNPNHIRGHWFLGWILEKQGILEQAIAMYRQATHIVTENAIELEDKIGAYLSLANTLANQGKGAEAIIELQAALLLQPNDPVIYSTLGYIMLDFEQQQTEAVALLQRAIELYTAQGNDEAVERLERSLQYYNV
ncbi:tetratricopeptide repeat protein [Scytonema sp. NUACC26]|uniref:tetratricopeptide repeat protein n=1 Tax=Scytonema sp. NUACC26 TaxID=3140176 RepID=UPI0034DC6EC3